MGWKNMKRSKNCHCFGYYPFTVAHIWQINLGHSDSQACNIRKHIIQEVIKHCGIEFCTCSYGNYVSNAEPEVHSPSHTSSQLK